MERATILVFAGFLAYICFVLTTINTKLDEFNASNIQYAALTDVGPVKSSGRQVGQMAMRHQPQPFATPMHVGLVLIAGISVFVSWHLSRIYHTHEWTKTVLRKNFAPYTEPYRASETCEALHMDQDCVGDPPSPDGRIKDSWLPVHIIRLDTGTRKPHSESEIDFAQVRSAGLE